MKRLARAAIIAAIYVVLIFMFHPFSFWAGFFQFRLAEALTVLPILYPESILGLYVGVLIGNIMGEGGLWDIIGGSLVTLVAAYITYRYRNSWIAYASPIVLNAIFVSLYLHFIYGVPYWLMAISIGISQSVVVLGAGIPLIRFLKKLNID